jgi:(p)ppGpp synthase/HD superfamily hydrolase
MGDVLHKPLTNRFSDALTFAAEIHRHQPRKGTQIPYVSHVIGVASIGLEYGADEDEGIAALLHDAIAGTIGYYCGLVAAFQRRAPQLADARLIPLIAELARTVSAIERDTGIAGVWPLASA